MRLRATVLAAFAIATCVAATARDTAVIVNSGSTNTYGYTIAVGSDGKATLTLQERGGAATGTPKSFTLPAATAARFFADLAAARKGNVASVPCMKSASFGTSTNVTWQGWVSPDISCPPDGALSSALVTDVDAIRRAAGVGQLPLHSQAPRIQPS